MSMGRRVAKRSIVGTRVSAPDKATGIFYTGVIQAMTTGENGPGRSVTKYSVRFDSGILAPQEYFKHQIIGPGFQTVSEVGLLRPGQKVFLTHQGREVQGTVLRQTSTDDVIVRSQWTSQQGYIEIRKELEEIRLMESRKSARLADNDSVDYAKLADSSERKRSSSSWIDVPNSSNRKRRPVVTPSDQACDVEMKADGSTSAEDEEVVMDSCMAAMVLMNLSCSPHSPKFAYSKSWTDGATSPSGSSDTSWKSSNRYNGNRSLTPSPPLRTQSPRDDCIQSDGSDASDDDDDRLFIDLSSGGKKKRRVFRCTWRGCTSLTPSRKMIEKHIRLVHLGPKPSPTTDFSDHEEDFYYTEDEADDHASLAVEPPSPSYQPRSYQETGYYLEEAHNRKSYGPTLSHMDMARPPYEDPEYLNTTAGAYFPHSTERPSVIRQHSRTRSVSWSAGNADAVSMKTVKTGRTTKPSSRRNRDGKKCRKVYGLEHRELWCTQCKWKKACTRFGLGSPKETGTITVYAEGFM